MQTRIERYEKYRTRIATSPEWTFALSKKRALKHSADEKAYAGKTLSSNALSLDKQTKKKHVVGYEKYKQQKQTLSIMKFTLFAVALIFMIVLYVLWVR